MRNTLPIPSDVDVQLTPTLPADVTLTYADVAALQEAARTEAAKPSAISALANVCDDAIIAARRAICEVVGDACYERITPLLDLIEAAVRAGEVA